MMVELKLEQWIKAGIDLYRTNPRMLETVFFDLSQAGLPTGLAPGILQDTNQIWLPDEYAGGLVRYGDFALPIVSNTADTLTVEGDPSLTADPDGIGYVIVPRQVPKLVEVFHTLTFSVQTAFPQLPTQLPALTIRLERDTQGETYIDEAMLNYVVGGVEYDTNRARMTGSYVISLWSVNRLETLWLYAWLCTYALQSMQQFATWGLSDVAIGGSDLDPALQFLPERTYVRHFILTATRDEWAVFAREAEYVTGFDLRVIAHYARFDLRLPAMGN